MVPGQNAGKQRHTGQGSFGETTHIPRSPTSAFHQPPSFYCLTDLASKRQWSKTKASLKRISTSKSRSRAGNELTVFANFVIPLAGVLSSVAARFYELGGPVPEMPTQADQEREPLLPRSNSNGNDADTLRVKKAGRWAARNAVGIFTSILFLGIIVILCVFFSTHRNKPKSSSGVCLSPACVHASSEILYNLSPDYKSIDPCTNFEELVCGGWNERHDLRPDQGDAFTGTIMAENSQMLLRHILEAPYPEDSQHSSFSPAQLLHTLSSVDQNNFNKLKDAYDACMDEDKIKKKGVKPLMEIVHEVAEMFPVKTSKTLRDKRLSPDDAQALSETITFLHKLGVSAIISFSVGADDKDPDTVVVAATPPYRIGLPAKDYYEDDTVTEKYEDVLTQIAENLSPAHDNSTIHNGWAKRQNYGNIAILGNSDLAHEVVELEKALAAASPDAEDRDDVTQYYNPMSLKDANKLAPQIHLSSIINGLAPAGVETTRIIVTSPSYIKNLTNIIADTSKEVLQSYFIWKVIQSFASAIEADELEPYSRFTNELQGKDPESRRERWRTCVNHVDDGLGWILSRFFVEKAFSEKAKIFGDQIVSDIKETFIEKLQKTTWMDKSVMESAIEKVHKIVQKIGYPTKSPNIMDPSSLYETYRSVSITPTTFFENALSMSRFAVSEEWSALGKPVDRDAWEMSVPTVNAYYNPPGNEIVFPAGIMQFPVFDEKVPQYLSYGAFGSVSGHELSHAFDSTGRHYDQNGNYTDWWTRSTVSNFEKRADCFVNQYAKYTVPGPDDKPLHVNGRLTLGENIADAGGVAAAFSAWKKHQAEKPELNQNLPGLSDHFTQDQLFFVSYANWWCGKSRKETAINRIYTDPHAPKWARILGTMANSREFKESFNCKTKEPVCELW